MMSNQQTVIEKLRTQCLRRGVGGLKELSVVFRSMDVDFSKKICYQELEEGVKRYGLSVSKEELSLLFTGLDKDRNNLIDFMEFVNKLRPPMSQSRVNVVNEAFDRLDHNKDGKLVLDDLKIVYSNNAKNHPKYLSGEWTLDETLRSFLDSIDTPGNPDGKVTREEFMNYYAGVSSTVDDDLYFDLMMRSCYGLPNKGAKK